MSSFDLLCTHAIRHKFLLCLFPHTSLCSKVVKMKRLLGFSGASATALVAPSTTQKRDIGVYLPKADIWMENFSINREYNEFRHKSGRVPDHNIEKYRALYWRVDETFRRGEAYIRKSGYFFLPTLDFAMYKGCQPLFSGKQMRLHYGQHHRAYVERLNKLIVGTIYDKSPLDAIIKTSVNDPNAVAIFNNAAQHYNHMFFWKTIQPWGANIPPDMLEAIEKQYGTLDAMKDAIKSNAMSFFGSGWLWWVYDESLKRFDILTLPNAGTPLTMPGVTPLLNLDLWEHTYYLDYENEKAKYFDRFWDVVDWHWAERNWKKATKQPYEPMVWV